MIDRKGFYFWNMQLYIWDIKWLILGGAVLFINQYPANNFHGCMYIQYICAYVYICIYPALPRGTNSDHNSYQKKIVVAPKIAFMYPS